MSEAARIDLVDRAPLTEKQQNVYESIMQYQRVNGYAPTMPLTPYCLAHKQKCSFLWKKFLRLLQQSE